MNNIPNLVGYRLESALTILSDYNCEIITKETFGKKAIKTEEIRVLRQTIDGDNKLKLIIGYF